MGKNGKGCDEEGHDPVTLFCVRGEKGETNLFCNWWMLSTRWNKGDGGLCKIWEVRTSA